VTKPGKRPINWHETKQYRRKQCDEGDKVVAPATPNQEYEYKEQQPEK
jgi:hypothetical protein